MPVTSEAYCAAMAAVLAPPLVSTRRPGRSLYCPSTTTCFTPSRTQSVPDRVAVAQPLQALQLLIAQLQIELQAFHLVDVDMHTVDAKRASDRNCISLNAGTAPSDILLSASNRAATYA